MMGGVADPWSGGVLCGTRRFRSFSEKWLAEANIERTDLQKGLKEGHKTLFRFKLEWSFKILSRLIAILSCLS